MKSIVSLSTFILRDAQAVFFYVVSPNGVMFVKPSVRKSLLAKMLQEILDTRVMVKTSMKEYKDDKVMHLIQKGVVAED